MLDCSCKVGRGCPHSEAIQISTTNNNDDDEKGLGRLVWKASLYGSFFKYCMIPFKTILHIALFTVPLIYIRGINSKLI